MADPSDPYSKEGMEALVKERALLKLERRAAKKAELKIQRELIEKRMMSEPVAGTPFPEDCFDKLMSNDVLEMILVNLTDPVDVISAYNACGTFQNILEPKRKAMLLPEVLNIFFDQKFGFNPEIALRQILSLRLMSKSWKKVVDKYLFGEEENTKCEWYFKKVSRGRTLSLKTIGKIKRAVSVLSTMSESDKKLFVGRLRIDPEFSAYGRRRHVPNFVNEFYAGVSEFLERFGDSVWEIHLFLRGLPMGEAYGLLVYWATLMPGIKTLDVTLKGIDPIEDAPDFCRRIARQSFPSLPLLRKCYCVDGNLRKVYECNILSEIIQANPWIVETSRLHSLNHEQDDDDDIWKHFFQLTNGNADFPRLGYRHLDKVKLETARVSGFLRQLTIGTWPLKKLMLELGPKQSGLEHATYGLIARNLKNLKGTLTHLEICAYSSFDSGMEYWDLPNLKTLKISMTFKDPRLDFLLPMKSLESLIFCFRELFAEYGMYREDRSNFFRLDKTEKIKFKGLLLRMEDSNITQVFPFLQKMEIRGNCHRIHYFREADVLKLTEKDRNILADIQKETEIWG